jgi:hypothetical protein
VLNPHAETGGRRLSNKVGDARDGMLAKPTEKLILLFLGESF